MRTRGNQAEDVLDWLRGAETTPPPATPSVGRDWLAARATPDAAAPARYFEAWLEGEEVMAPNGTVRVRFSHSVDTESAQAGFRFAPDLRGDVHFNSEATMATWVPAAPVPAGRYRLALEGILDSRRQVRAPARYTEFAVGQGEAAVGPPAGHKVLHRARAVLPILRERYQLTKLIDNGSGQLYQTATNERGEAADFDAALNREQQAHFAHYGKLHPTLYDEIRRRREGTPISVAVWAYVAEEEVDKSGHVAERGPLVAMREEEAVVPGGAGFPPPSPPAALLRYRQQVGEVKARVRALLQRAGIAVRGEMGTVPVLHTMATRAQIEAMAAMPDVSRLFLYEPEGIEDLSDSMTVSHAKNVVDTLGWKGTGIRVAVWENGADVLTDLDVVEHFDPTRAATSSHARLVTSIIRNHQASGRHGYAPEAKIYSANQMTLDALEWAVVRKECRAVNQSFHRRTEAHGNTPSLDDLVKDYLAVHYPFPTICQAAGNFWATDSDGVVPPSNEYVNHKGYNSLTVGNHDDTASTMDGSSVFRNPTSPHRDRELPEISANGDQVTAAGVTMGGTSFASPAVTGSVALLQNINSTLLDWPEGNRAILLAGAGRNVSGRTWWDDVSGGIDGSDGAGALDTEESARIAMSRQARDNAAVMRGWNIGTLADGDFGANHDATFVNRVQVPERGRRRVRVALAWDSKTTYTAFKISGFDVRLATSVLTMDHDLYVYDGTTLVAHSTSWDNSYEVVDFIGTPGKAYTIRIHRASGTGWTYYGIAWTVHD